MMRRLADAMVSPLVVLWAAAVAVPVFTTVVVAAFSPPMAGFVVALLGPLCVTEAGRVTFAVDKDLRRRVLPVRRHP